MVQGLINFSEELTFSMDQVKNYKNNEESSSEKRSVSTSSASESGKSESSSDRRKDRHYRSTKNKLNGKAQIKSNNKSSRNGHGNKRK